MAKAVQRINIFKPKSTPSRGCFHPGASMLSRDSIKIPDQREVSGRDMINAMLRYIWPSDDPQIRHRVKVALGLLVGAKSLNVCVPFTFKYAVDYLNTGNTLAMTSPSETIITVATSLLLGCT